MMSSFDPNSPLAPGQTSRWLMVEQQLRKRGIRDARVLSAMARVPREEFVARELRSRAYEDSPLPIGERQTISQPYIVAAMLEAIALQGEEHVLEVGTGSGYQTALLGELASSVVSIERHAELARGARVTLERLGYQNVRVEIGDGTQGFPEAAPYD